MPDPTDRSPAGQSAALRVSLADRYTIARELGAGGMATVYLAQDLKHDRKVALKVLRPELAAVIGAERFLAEIKTTANLQHPHILALFDSGKVDGSVFYVMPYVEGESLRDRLTREKQLPIDDAVRIATEVADALQYAHGHSVIHRDIKPENILLHGGHALVADFGIALAAATTGGARMTETGMSLGTPHYMSPEQAMGERTLDPRTDIYALGCVLYEMLIGEPPFSGPTAQAIVAKVMTEKPIPPSRMRDTVPARVEHTVLTALQKLRADRFASAKDFADALAGSGVSPEGHWTTIAAAAARPGWGARVTHPALLVVTAVSLLTAAWALATRPAPAPGTVIRFPLDLAPGTPVPIANTNPLAISPDGDIVAFSARAGDGPRQIFVRRMDQLAGHALPGTEGGEQPFFSPDGQWLGFVAGHQLKRVALAGGPPILIADLPGVFNGACWAPDGRIVVARGDRLQIVPALGGTLSPLSPTDTVAGRLLFHPKVLADGKTVIVTRWRGTIGAARLWIATIGKGEPRNLGLSGGYALGMIDGHLVYAGTTGTLMAVPFDPGRQQVTGPAVPVLEGVPITIFGVAPAALSKTGSLVYQTGALLRQVVIADLRTGAATALPATREYIDAQFSPDGSRIAVSLNTRGSADVWIYDRRSQTLGRISTEGTTNDRPEWTPDGRRLIYRSNRSGELALWTQPADGGGRAELLQRQPGTEVWDGVPTADGRTLIFRTGTYGTADIWARSLVGDTTPRPLATTPFTEWAGRPSRDGRWLAYESDESGEFQVYVRPLAEGGARQQISVDGGIQPVWSRDGRRLFYRKGEELVAATLATGAELSVISRATVFRGEFPSSTGHANYDISPDGSQVVLLKPVADSAQTLVVLNWSRELRARLRKTGT